MLSPKLGSEGCSALDRAHDFAQTMKRRRSVREFSDRPVDKDLIRYAIEAAVRAPSGVNRQPWRFVAISDPSIKTMVGEIACEEETAQKQERKSSSLVNAIAPFGPDKAKPYFDDASWLIAIFAQKLDPSTGEHDLFYVEESVGIATGMLVTGLHLAGLSSLVHVPVAQDYLADICAAREKEWLYLLVLAGYARLDAHAPAPSIEKKSFHQVAEFFE